tara:strand:- start:6 stop:848 length:843 start_codon:yes stop_codon:yes gene_type:complete
MPLQEKNIKGFSILELIVVLAIVAVITATAYPNFSEWNNERAVRSDVDKITALIRNTYTQTERGALAYVQVYFNKTDEGLFVEGRGLTMSTLATKINKGDDDWNDPAKIGERCSMTDTDWDTHKVETNPDTGDITSTAPAEISNLVYDITVENVTTPFDGEAAICFSRNGKFYGGDRTNIAQDGTPVNFIFLCSVKRSDDCNIGTDYGLSKDIKDKPDPVMCTSATFGCSATDQKNLYLNAIKWSRYGNIGKVKWQVKRGSGGEYNGFWSDEAPEEEDDS